MVFSDFLFVAVKKVYLLQGNEVKHDGLHGAYFSPYIVLMIMSRRMMCRMFGGEGNCLEGFVVET